MKNYKKKIETIKDEIIDDIIKMTIKNGRYISHYFVIPDDDVVQAVRYEWDKCLNLCDRNENYKNLSIHFHGRNFSSKFYVKDSKEGEIYRSHFDARLMSVDLLYQVLETIK